MGQIEETIEVYERLRQKKYKINIENGMSFILSFEPEMYHHLVGYQHLTDIVALSSPGKKRKFYGDIKRGRIAESLIVNSAKYHEILERVQNFKYIEEILSAGEGKVIVEFDKSKLDTDINAKFNLYKREGAALSEQHPIC